jgi:hypothetical protein
MGWLVQYAQTAQHILLNTHPSHTSLHTFLVHIPRLFCMRKNIAPLSRFHQSCADRGEVNEAILLVLLLAHLRWKRSLNVPTAGAQAFFMDLPTRRTGYYPPRKPSADWWVLTTANTAGTNG